MIRAFFVPLTNKDCEYFDLIQFLLVYAGQHTHQDMEFMTYLELQAQFDQLLQQRQREKEAEQNP